MSKHKVILVFHWFTCSGLVYWESIANPVRFQGNSTECWGIEECGMRNFESVTTLTEDLKALSCEGWC